MANEMEHLTDDILRGAVERQVKDEFDTHPVFITLMTDFGYAYVCELDKCLVHEDPFKKLHTQIGRRLASEALSDTLKQLHRKRRSKNFRGNAKKQISSTSERKRIMANEMEHLTDRILRDAVERQVKDEFDTHPVFITLMTDFGYAYVCELDKCLVHEDPFKKLHTQIGRRLASEALSDTLKQLHRKRRSKNFRGNIDECEIWRKVE